MFSRCVLSWSIYRRSTPQAEALCVASGSDPLKQDESPVQRIMQLIEQWTGHAAIPEVTEPNHWAWYGDHGTTADVGESWSVFAELIVFL